MIAGSRAAPPLAVDNCGSRGYGDREMKKSPRRSALRLTALLLCLAAPVRANSDPRPVPHYVRYDQLEVFTSESGLSQNTVRCILQDRKGFLWFGTDDGLNRFDGYQFRVFRQRPDIPVGLPHNRVTALHEDPSGQLWVGTMDGLFRFDPNTARYIPAALGSLRSTEDGVAIRRIHESPREPGVLWIGTSRGLHQLELQTGQAREFPLAPDAAARHDLKSVSALAETPDGRLWVGIAGGGLRWLDRTTGRFTPSLPEHDTGAHPVVRSITDLACSRDGNLLIGSSAGLEILDPATGAVRSAFLAESHYIEVLSESPDGQVWMGTEEHGLDQYIPHTAFIEHRNCFERRAHDTMGMILSLCRDRSGNLWIGTRSGGIFKLSRHAQDFLIYTAEPEDSFILPFSNVQSILQDARGRLWVGGYCGWPVPVTQPTRCAGFTPSPSRVSARGETASRPSAKIPRTPGRCCGSAWSMPDFAGSMSPREKYPQAGAIPAQTGRLDPNPSMPWGGTKAGVCGSAPARASMSATHPRGLAPGSI